MNWRQMRLAIILGILVLVFVSPMVVSGDFTDQDRQLLENIAGKGLDIWDKMKSTYKKTVELFERTEIYEIKGTEYQAVDNATIFLQLLNGTTTAVNDASCYLDIYYPDKTSYYSNALMYYLNGSDGLYYFEIDNLPNILGVYMISAYCIMPSNAFSDVFDGYSYFEDYENITISGGKIVLTSGVSFVITDSSGNGRDGTMVNMEGSDWVAGKLDYALQFDGVNEYVDCGDIANFERTDAFSLEAWFKVSVKGTLFSRRDNSEAPYRGWQVTFDGLGRPTLILSNTYGSNTITVRVDTNYVDNSWHHIIITYDGSSSASGVKFYIDGNSKTITITENTLSATIQVPKKCQIGAIDGTDNPITGLIDEVVIYNKELNSTEVAFRYNNGTGTESMMDGIIPYGWWHLNPVSPETEGFIQSISIPLPSDATDWMGFFSDYDNKNGNIEFKVLDSNNNTLCTEIGNISSCAGTTSPIKLYANLTRPAFNTSPEIDRWWITFGLKNYQEVRGSGEMHISSPTDDLWRRIRNLMLLLHSTEVTNRTCIDPYTLREEKFITYEIGDEKKIDELNLSKSQNIYCVWGCTTVENNSFCNPDPLWRNIILLIVIIVILCIVAGLLRLGGIV